MFSFSMPELVLILVIALVVFGPGKLPEVGKALGKGIQEFRKATTGETTQEPATKVESKTEDKK
jgi:sec-independent protein translocase protein TatA